MTENLTINGINIYYKGNIKQGAVVFIHGSSLNGMVFEEQFKQIASFPMLAIDLPGHGLPEKANSAEPTYNVTGYASRVAEIVAELELVGFILAGHSLGGNVAIEVAELLPGSAAYSSLIPGRFRDRRRSIKWVKPILFWDIY
jgi:pimeloyl-ACP methyl ester carboxylesterase